MNTVSKKFTDVLCSKKFMFLVAAVSMFALTFNVDLLTSGDALETWKVAKTFFADDKHYSYVMYKGLYAFIPTVIDYLISTALNIPPLYIFKAFNALCFGYVAIYGIPFLVEAIHPNKKVTVWQRYLLLSLLLIFEYNINYTISVDMPSCTLFFMLCNSVIKVTRNNNLHWYNYLVLGLLFGINMCHSGQFAISTVIVVAACIIGLSYKHFKQYGIPRIKKHIPLIASVVFIFLGFIIARLPNELYMDLVVWTAKDAGAWIPTGGEWIINGLSQNLLIINYPESLPDYLSMGMLTSEQLESVNAGAAIFSYSDYFKLVLQHPFEFIVRWSQRMFLGMFNDPDNTMFITVKHFNIYLISMAVIIYGFYDQFKARFKKYKDFISVEMAIYIGFLFSALVPSFGHVENRYFFTARCLVFGVFALSPFLNETVNSIKQKIKQKTIEPVNYKFWGCVIFVLLSLIIYYAIYQSAGLPK